MLIKASQALPDSAEKTRFLKDIMPAAAPEEATANAAPLIVPASPVVTIPATPCKLASCFTAVRWPHFTSKPRDP